MLKSLARMEDTVPLLTSMMKPARRAVRELTWKEKVWAAASGRNRMTSEE